MEHTETEDMTEAVEQGDYINRDNVELWDANESDKRYKQLNVSPRDTQAGQEGYLLKDRETGAVHVTNLDTDLSQPDYRVNAVDIELLVKSIEMTDAIIEELEEGIEYDHYISMDSVRLEYAEDVDAWTVDDSDDNWDIKAAVETETEGEAE